MYENKKAGMPDVSVVIPTYNRLDFLKEAITSCFERNDTISVEVIVVDDGSTDETRRYLESIETKQVKPIFQQSQGAQVARNRGKEAASGKFVKFLDDDDWLTPGTLVKEVDLLKKSGADFSYGNFRIQEANNDWVYQQRMEDDAPSAIFKESMWTPPFSFLYKREVIQDIEWSEHLPYHQDYAFALQIACIADTPAHVDAVVGVIRRHREARINDSKAQASRSEYYTTKVDLIKRGISSLNEQGLIEPYHRQAAAEGIWNWAHIVAGYDLETFRQFCDDIEAIASGFHPERDRSWLAVLDIIVSPKGTEHLLYPARRMKRLLK